MKNLYPQSPTKTAAYPIKAPAGKISRAVANFMIKAVLLTLAGPVTAFAQAPGISYINPQVYTQGVAITSLVPANSGGAVAAPGYSNQNQTIYTGFNNPYGVVADQAGILYVADRGAGTVSMIPAGAPSPVTIATGFIQPEGLAIDASHNIFVADAGQHQIVEIPAAGGGPIILRTGFNYPVGVAVDAAGNVYVTDSGAQKVYKIPVGGGATVTISTIFSNPQGIAIDGSGNIYVADASMGLRELPANGSNAIPLAPGLNNPAGVAIDGTGNLFVTNSSSVYEIAAGPATAVMIGDFVNSADGVTADGFGNVFFTDNGNNILYKISPTGGYFVSPALPAGLNISTATGVISGTPASEYGASNFFVTAWNAAGNGSAVLNIAVNPPPPTITYSSPQTYTAGTSITPLSPPDNTVGSAAYGNANTLIGTGLDSPFGVAVDAAGDVYVVDSDGQIKEFPAGGGAEMFLASGFSEPFGISVDAAGDIYIADTGNNVVKEIPAGQTVPITLDFTFNDPSYAMADAAGNVYIADRGNNRVIKIPAGTNQGGQIGSGFSSPSGIAVDAAGNVYISDQGNNAVKMIPAQGGPVVTIATGINAFGLAIDACGNLFVSDYLNNAIKEIPVGSSTPIALGSGFKYPGSVAVDNKGDVFVADAGNGAIKKLIPTGGYYLGSPLPVGLTLNNNTGLISGTPAAASPATNYLVTAYNTGGSGQATVNIKVVLPAAPKIQYTSPQSYVKGTAITTLLPTITGVAAAAYNSIPVALKSGFSGPGGVAVDAAGNVYIADSGNSLIKKIPAGGGAVVTIGTGFSYPVSVAVDVAGNVYVADRGNFTVKKIPANGSATITLGSGYLNPDGVAVDLKGNVYVADRGTAYIQKIPAGGGAPVNIGSGLLGPDEVAVDGAGNVYVADNSGYVEKISATDGTTTDIKGGYEFGGVAVDSAGNVFVSDVNTNYVQEIPANGGALVTIGSGFNYPEGLAVDGAGDVYVADLFTNSIKEIKPVGGYYINTMLPAGLSFSNASGAISGTPSVGSPATNYTITAYNAGGGTSAVVNIKVVANATLSKLTVSSGTLTPTFATGTTSYTDKVAGTVDSLAVRAITTDPTATETINGTAVAEGTVSPYIQLSVGANTINIVVTAQDGVTKDTYTIVVTRISNIATLSKLTISNGTLSPAFATATTSYTDVAHAVSSIAIRATTTDPTATETINGAAVPEGTVSYYVPLNAGVNNITIVVTAQDGVTKDTYTIAVTRLPEIATLSKLTISSGTLSPAFATATTSYTDVAHSVSSIAFRATTTDALATETINGTAVPEGTVSYYVPLNAGVNNIKIVVTAQDGVTMDTYTVAVTRLPEIATLSKLTISNGTLSPAFASGTTSYTDVAHSVSSIAFRATTTDPLATETINGTAVPEGTVSYYVPLNTGVNNITVVVTAQDGVTKGTYTIAVTRLPEIATLSKLTVSSGTLTPAFAAATTSYTDNVANTVSSIAFRATTTDALATETIDGTVVPEGTVSFYVPLNVGVNKIPLVVTAEDGVTTDTYTIAVTRAAPSVADAVYQPVSVEIPETGPRLEDDVVIVHQGVSPNGDGVDDFLQIDGILAFPDNRLMIMNRNGMLVYEIKGYDNSARIFDGHSNKNGQMQLPGTYFYQLDYTVKGITKHKTGFLVLKY